MLIRDQPGPADPEAADTPGATLRSLPERAAGLRRHLMQRLMVAAAAVTVIVADGAVAVSRVAAPPVPGRAVPALPWAATVQGSDPRTGAAATIRYAAQPWGMQMQAQVSGIGPGTRCELLVLGDGRRVVAGGWMVAAGHAGTWYPASAALLNAAARGFVVATTTGSYLVRVPVR